MQFYDVSTYYAQGNELSASVEDAKGNKYTETRNEYDGYYLTANGDKYTFTKQTKLCSDRASAFVPLRYTAISNMRDRQPASPSQRLGTNITSQAITES